jgi:hypothetical protein
MGLGNMHTLARKFDAVHKKTVTSRRKIPSVRRATFSKPTPALKPRGFNVDLIDDIDTREICEEDLS